MAPFDYTVPDENIIPNFHRLLLKEEGPEILALLIFFAGEYYRNGEGPKAFPPCKAVDETSAEYLDSEDLVLRWKTERTEAAEGNAERAEDLYRDFRRWAEDENVRKVMSKNKFGEHLGAHVPDKKRIDHKWHYSGVKLKPKPAFLPGEGGG